MNTVAFVDLVFVIILVLMTLRGNARGIVKEVFSWAALVVGIFAAIFLYKDAAGIIREKLPQNLKILADLIGFAAVFVIAFVGIRIARTFLDSFIKVVKIEWLDKLLGGVFGFVEGLVLIILALFVINILPLSASPLDGSLFANILLPYIQGIKETAGGKASDVIAVLPFFAARNV
jgi:membrane protein required for colicin V production